MRITRFCKRLIAASLLTTLGVVAAVAAEPPPGGEVVNGAWVHHHVRISYYGITSLYSCSGLEGHVKGILLHFGARPDAKVSASGCPYGPDVPSRTAWVDADFDTLASTDTASADAVKAQWRTRELTPTRPYFMGDGDCELVQQMKDMIAKNFSLRDLSYTTTCTPHEIYVNGFSVRAAALIAMPASKEAASR